MAKKPMSHGDEKQDKAMISKMVKPSAMKKPMGKSKGGKC